MMFIVTHGLVAVPEVTLPNVSDFKFHEEDLRECTEQLRTLVVIINTIVLLEAIKYGITTYYQRYLHSDLMWSRDLCSYTCHVSVSVYYQIWHTF
jgi:hypothetical protein